MRRLVVDGAGQQEHPGRGEMLAELIDVAQAVDSRKPDRPRRRTHPVKNVRPAGEELVEQREVALDDLEVPLKENVAISKRQRGQQLARRTRADRRVVLEIE